MMAKSKMNKRNNRVDRENNQHYRNKCKTMKRIIKDAVFENAAVCDEISLSQTKLLIVREECKFLLKKLKHHEPPPLVIPAVKVETKPVVKKPVARKKSNTNGTVKQFQANVKQLQGTVKQLQGTVKQFQGTVKQFQGTVKQATVNKKKRPTVKKIRKKDAKEIQEPIEIGEVTVYNFGQIVYDTPFYYTDSAIYPAGYYATRTYAHFRNIFSKCTYHCKVIKTGSSPRFEIMDHDKHFKVTGLSTDECHSHLISLVNKMLGADDLIPSNRNGDRFFGLTLPFVRLRLQRKPESKYCTGYVPLNPQLENDETELKAENDPSISFEGLHACLNRFRSRR